MGAALDLPGAHRQRRLGAIESLDRGLLVDAHDHSVLGRVHVETNDVADLVHELGVLGQLEAVGGPRLEPERLPDPTYRRRRHPRLLRQVAGGPVGGVGGLVLQGAHHHRFDLSIGDLAGGARPGLVDQAVQAARDEPLAPLQHRRRVHPNLLRHRHVRQALAGQQHDPGSLSDRVRRLRPTSPTLQGLSFLIRHSQRLAGTTTFCHSSTMNQPR